MGLELTLCLNKPYKCKHCGKEFVILSGKWQYSFVPVNNTGKEMFDKEFDKERHRSHLLDCQGLTDQWESVKEILRKQVWNEAKKNNSQMLK